MRGKSDEQELQQCNVDIPITIEVSRKSEVDQTIEIVSNEYCLGEEIANNLTKKTSVGKENSAKTFCTLNLDLFQTIHKKTPIITYDSYVIRQVLKKSVGTFSLECSALSAL